MRQSGKIAPLILAVIGVSLLGLFIPGTQQVLAQQPTGSIPTVTGTAEGAYVRVYSDLSIIRVWSGPSSLGDYPAIGVLLANETAPALGRAQGRLDWIQIYYPGVTDSVGWIYAPYVRLFSSTDLKTVDVPATPTAQSTPTINPTLVAAFIGQQTATRLPTFTPPPPLDLPQFTDQSSTSETSGVPTGLLIIGLGLFGFFGVLISYLRGR